MNVASNALDTLSRGVLRGTAWWSGCIAALQYTGAALEYWRNEPLLLWLDIASGSMSFGSVLACVSPLTIQKKRRLTILLMGLTVLLEVETAFHDPDYHFHDARQYLIVVVSMLFLAIVFPGSPSAFTISALVFIGYYLFRSAVTDVPFPGMHAGIVFVLQLLFSVLICAGIQFRIFRLRYTNIVQADELSVAQRKLGRQMMLRDIHDHLGAKLADLSNLAARVRIDRSDEMFAALESAAGEAALLLRRGLLAERDREMLAEDFGSALRVILFGRYEIAGRQILVRFKDTSTEDYLRGIDPVVRNDLLAIIFEITTNDLKYGHSTSVLEFRIQGKNLQMRFVATTSQPRSRGLGTDSLQKRVHAHGGRLSTLTNKRRILIRVHWPVEPEK